MTTILAECGRLWPILAECVKQWKLNIKGKAFRPAASCTRMIGNTLCKGIVMYNANNFPVKCNSSLSLRSAVFSCLCQLVMSQGSLSSTVNKIVPNQEQQKIQHHEYL